MQTILVLQCASPGAVYLNGRLLGEIDPSHTLSLPVSPTGALIIEMRPFERDLLPLAFRLTLSRGVPMLSETADERYCTALWCGSVVEIELLPQQLPTDNTFLFEYSSILFSMTAGREPRLQCSTARGDFSYLLPHGALAPSLTPLHDELLLSGRIDGEADEYALLLSQDAARLLLSLKGRSISLLEGGALRLLRPAEDTMGHAFLETWHDDTQGWTLASTEPMWLSGAPQIPSTPQDVAVAALEAAQSGMMNEARSFLAPMADCEAALERAAAFDGCTPLRYPLPDGENAVGLLKMDGSLLRVTPVRYQATRGGSYGTWQLTELKID